MEHSYRGQKGKDRATKIRTPEARRGLTLLKRGRSQGSLLLWRLEEEVDGRAPESLPTVAQMTPSW